MSSSHPYSYVSQYTLKNAVHADESYLQPESAAPAALRKTDVWEIIIADATKGGSFS